MIRPVVIYVITSKANGTVECATADDSQAFCLYRDCPGIYEIEVFINGNSVAKIA